MYVHVVGLHTIAIHDIQPWQDEGLVLGWWWWLWSVGTSDHASVGLAVFVINVVIPNIVNL